jgi:hypothetical protein
VPPAVHEAREYEDRPLLQAPELGGICRTEHVGPKQRLQISEQVCEVGEFTLRYSGGPQGGDDGLEAPRELGKQVCEPSVCWLAGRGG